MFKKPSINKLVKQIKKETAIQKEYSNTEWHKKTLMLTAENTIQFFTKKQTWKDPITNQKCRKTTGEIIQTLQEIYYKTANLPPEKKKKEKKHKKNQYYIMIQLGDQIQIPITKSMGEINIRHLQYILLITTKIPMPYTTFYWYNNIILEKQIRKKDQKKNKEKPCPTGIYKTIIQELENTKLEEPALFIYNDRIYNESVLAEKIKRLITKQEIVKSIGLLYKNNLTTGGLIIQNLGSYNDIELIYGEQK